MCSCTKKMIPGKYIYNDYGYIDIDKNSNYEFRKYYALGKGPAMFSKGKISFKNKVIDFLPDSSFFLHIRASKYSYDSSLKDSIRIILKNFGTEELSDFIFNIEEPLKQAKDFNIDSSVTYRPVLQNKDDGWVILNAKLRATFAPAPIHSTIFSNTIYLIDVNNDDPDDKPWNVLELKVFVDERMFRFTTLPPYIFEKGKLTEKDRPVYKLEK